MPRSLVLVFSLLAPALGGCVAVRPPVGVVGAYAFAGGELAVITRGSGSDLRYVDTRGEVGRLRAGGAGGLELTPAGLDRSPLAVRTVGGIDGEVASLEVEGRVARRLVLPETRGRVVSFDGTVLNARLLLPPTDVAPVAAVVLVHGSGHQAATETYEHGYFLASAGVATAVYDKRGTGASGGVFTFDFEVLARDVAAVVRWLRERPEAGPAAVGLVGFSQGGWVAPLAATLVDVDFVVVHYGMTSSPAEEERQETLLRLAERGFSPQDLAEADELIRASLPILASNFRDGWSAFDAVAAGHRDRPWTRRLEGTTIGAFLAYPRWLLRWLGPRRAPPAMPWYHDGLSVLRRVGVPVVWLLGEDDQSAPNRDTLRDVAALAAEGRRHQVLLFAGAGHGIRLVERRDGRRIAGSHSRAYLTAQVTVVRALAAGHWPVVPGGVTVSIPRDAEALPE